MPDYRRPKVTGACIFFTVNLAAPGSDLLTREVVALRRSIARTKSERPFCIDAFVVLPDHLHCIWTLPPGDRDFSTRWRLIKSRFSRTLPQGPTRPSHEKRNERGIWQRRFWEHHIRNEDDFNNHIRYCWFNPIKHGLVERPEDWPYSSIHRDIISGRFTP